MSHAYWPHHWPIFRVNGFSCVPTNLKVTLEMKYTLLFLVLLASCSRESTLESLTCMEFVSPDDQSVFNSTGLIRSGTKISAKTKQDCKGVYMQDVVVK